MDHLDRDELYACGLNNRGQLGLAQPNNKDTNCSVTNPIKIGSLSKRPVLYKDRSQSLLQSGKKSKSGKIQSYALV